MRLWGSNVWLDESAIKGCQKCFNDFYRYIGKRELDSLEVNGWECGLGQILDLNDPSIREVLPYLLTAYIYNFAVSKNEKYIRGFAKRVPQSQRTYKDDYFFGVKYFIEAKCSYGLGKFLCGDVLPDNPKVQEEIKNFSERFAFPDTIKMTLLTGLGVKTSYIIPAEKESSFSAGIKESIWIDYDTDTFAASSQSPWADVHACPLDRMALFRIPSLPTI